MEAPASRKESLWDRYCRQRETKVSNNWDWFGRCVNLKQLQPRFTHLMTFFKHLSHEGVPSTAEMMKSAGEAQRTITSTSTPWSQMLPNPCCNSKTKNTENS